jgi:methanesulfonate monooxygenase small subunit
MLALSERVDSNVYELTAFVSESCALLDREDFDGYMQLCAAGFNYKIVTHSPDLNDEMCWLDVNREELNTLLGALATHVRVPGAFFRNSGASFQKKEPDGTSRLVTPVSVFHTTPQGQTSIFAVCRYFDRVKVIDGEVRLADREVRLDTRLLEFAPHVVL